MRPLLLSTSTSYELALSHRSDLIWCGSLITHVEERVAADLLRFFYRQLSDDGVCVFTTHGRRSVRFIQDKTLTYHLTEDAQQRVVYGYEATGYGYADYPDQTGYGISIVSHQRILEMAKEVGDWSEVLFKENGWDNHQDVYAFVKRTAP